MWICVLLPASNTMTCVCACVGMFLCTCVCVCVCTCMCLHLLLWCVCAGLWATYRATRQDRARDWSTFCLDCLHSRHQPYSKVRPPVQQPVTSWFVAALASPICFPCCWNQRIMDWSWAGSPQVAQMVSTESFRWHRCDKTCRHIVILGLGNVD